MHFLNYTFRCSSLGKIMSAKGELTQTNKSALLEIFIEETEKVRKNITSKYFEKGIFCEEDGFDLLQKTLYPNSLILKNKSRLSNEFINGEHDTIVGDIVYDIKNAFDRITFAKADLTDGYEWQLRGYMWLNNISSARLFYCLNNMPEHMLVDEERKLFYANKFISFEDKEYLSLCDELRAFHNYDDKPIYERFKVWDVAHCEYQIETLKARIIKCRGYLNQLWAEKQATINKNIELMAKARDVIK